MVSATYMNTLSLYSPTEGNTYWNNVGRDVTMNLPVNPATEAKVSAYENWGDNLTKVQAKST